MHPFMLMHSRGADLVGYIPGFLNEDDPRRVSEQFDTNYAHGGGWHPMDGWTLNQETSEIQYPGDPPLEPIAAAVIREELVLVYDHAFVAIVQEDGSFEVARMD